MRHEKYMKLMDNINIKPFQILHENPGCVLLGNHLHSEKSAITNRQNPSHLIQHPVVRDSSGIGGIDDENLALAPFPKNMLDEDQDVCVQEDDTLSVLSEESQIWHLFQTICE